MAEERRTPRPRARKLAWLAAIAALVVAAGWAVRSRLEARQNQGASALTTVEARLGRIEKTITGTGRIQSKETVDVTPGVTGQVEKVLASEGQLVRSGDVLVTLSSADALSQVQEAKAKLEQARAKIAETLRMTWEEAMKFSAGPVYEFKAPADATIEDIRVSSGGEVQRGAVVAHLVDDSVVRLRAQVTGAEAECLSPGQQVGVRPDGYAGELPAEVAGIDSRGSPGETTIWYDLLVTVKNPGLLRADLGAVVSFQGPQGVRTERPGKLEWVREYWVRSPLSGMVETVAARKGQRVKAGDLLATVRNEGFPHEVEALRLSVRQAEEALAAKLEDLKKLNVTSPVDGLVTSISVHPGERVASDKVVAQVETVGDLHVVLPVDELDIPYVYAGQPAKVKVDALPDKEFEASVASVAVKPTVQSGVATYDVSLDLKASEGLMPGMTANVTIVIAAKDGVIVVPLECVTETDRGAYVRVLQADGSVTQKRVTLGLRSSIAVEVTEGLSAGEKIVVSSSSREQRGTAQPRPFMPGMSAPLRQRR